MVWESSKPPMPGESSEGQSKDSFDPSKNVLDLVLAAVRRLDDLGASVVKRQDDLRDALDKRITELNDQRTSYELRIENLKLHYETQLDAVKSDSGKQIANILASQAEKSANLLSTQVAATTERLAVVEKNQYVSGGQSAIRDPQTAQTLDAIQVALNKLTHLGDNQLGAKSGQAQVGTIMNAALIALIGIAAIVVPVILHFVGK